MTDPSVLTLITAGLTEVKEAVSQLSRDLHGTLSRLPTDYVPRRELERRLDEIVLDLAAERARCDGAFRSLKEASDKHEADRITGRRWLIGVAAATAMSAAGVLAGVITHFN